MKLQFPEYLWRACNETLDSVDVGDYDLEYHGLNNREREAAMSAALAQLVYRHPARPEGNILSSPSVNHLRDILKLGPTDKSVDEKSPDGPYGMDYYEDFTGDITFYWNAAYLQDLFEALIAVIEEHGIAGWESVRWEVYDKVSPLSSYHQGTSTLMPVAV